MAHALRLRGPLAGEPMADMFHVLLLVVATWMAFWSLATLRLAEIVPQRILYIVFLESSFVAALVLLRRGHLRRASLIYLAGIWIWATLVLTYAGTIRT